MTDVVDAPTAVKPINHWISGGRYAGESGRTGAGLQPGHAASSRAPSTWRRAEEVDRAVQAAKQAFPAWRATVARQARRALLRDP